MDRITGEDAFDAVLLLALGGDDTITAEAGLALRGTIDGGSGFDVFSTEDPEDRDEFTLISIEG